MPFVDGGAVVELRSDDRSEHIRLRATALQRDAYPSIEFAVEAQIQSFSGRSSVWLAEDALKAFILALAEFERTRSGRAVLESMDPAELRLAVSSLDASGHVLVELTLLRHAFVGARPRIIDVQISGGFELEPSSLPGVMSALETQIASLAG